MTIAVQRALGAVIGSAVGDALGGPFEFKEAGLYSKTFPQPVLGGIGEMTGGGGFGWEPAEFTDDTQMAVVQAESLLACGEVDGDDLFARFRAWSETATDVGVQTGSVLSTRGDPRRAAEAYYRAHPDRSAGNGGLMRATPSAVHFAVGPLGEALAAGRALAAVTHGDPAAQWGAALYHGLLWYALRGTDPLAELSSLLGGLPAGQSRYVEMLDARWQPGLTPFPNGTVWTCLAQAVWAVRRTTSFDDAVVTAIDLGGDTDTVAAVTGGLAGAIYGIQAIPSRWTTYLHGRFTRPDGGTAVYDNALLQTLALGLVGVTSAPLAPLTEPKGPVEVAAGLWAADLGQAATVPSDWAIVSLCRTGGVFDRHPVRRELFLIDQEGHNPSLARVIDDAVSSIDAFLAEGRQVVVHCHAGNSRTGFVLRAWLMRRHGCDEPTATQRLHERWPHLSTWNRDFTLALAQQGRAGG